MKRLLVLGVVLLAACTQQPPKPQATAPASDPFVAAFRELRPSVVLFTMKIPSDQPRKRGQYDEAYGSGVVVASGPWGSQILTVEHVIHDATNLRMTIGEKRTVPVRVVARDEKTDLALVDSDVPNLPAATLGTEELKIEPGMAIGVAGFPIPDAFADEGLGVATSVYAGRLSSIRKDALELDVPVIPGESGGPIFDAQNGVVIGLAESRFEEERAIGFGIPIADAQRFMQMHPHASLREPANERPR